MNNDRPDRCVTQQAQFMVADKRYKKKKPKGNKHKVRFDLVSGHNSILPLSMAGRHKQVRKNNNNNLK